MHPRRLLSRRHVVSWLNQVAYGGSAGVHGDMRSLTDIIQRSACSSPIPRACSTRPPCGEGAFSSASFKKFSRRLAMAVIAFTSMPGLSERSGGDATRGGEERLLVHLFQLKPAP